MTANIAVLTTNERTRDALSDIRSARFIWNTSGSGKTHTMASMIVAMLADLDRAQERHNLENLIVRFKGGNVPVVLLASSIVAPRTDAAFQGLAHLTWLVGREVYVAPDAAAVSRMVFARKAKAEGSLIASATVEDGKLVVWSCEPRRYAVAASEIPALAKMSPAELADFEVSETGSRIHWTTADVDLDLDAIAAYADPDIRRQREAERRQDAMRYATAVRKLREEHGLKQTDIKGLSERQVRRLEEGASLPHSSTLAKLAAAHGMAVENYLRELAKRIGRTNRQPAKVQSRAAKRR